MLRQFVPLSFTFALADCAATSGVSMAPAGMEAGKFVNYACEKGGFQASLES
ncbi:MAG: hypothetical protein ACXW13_04665 [Burkholderiaceae bacterium]